MTKEERDAQTCIWCKSSQDAVNLSSRLKDNKIKIPNYIENNLLILRYSLTKQQYKKLSL